MVGGRSPGTPRAFTIQFQLHNFVNIFTWISLFYVNAYVLMPVYFNKRKYRQYGLTILLLFLFLLGINWLSFSVLLPALAFRISGAIVFYLLPCLFILSWSIAYRILIDKVKEDKRIIQGQTETLKTELSFLRSQVSPHFMFNVLNNMVALARKKSDLLEPSLIKLSSLLRYMLYETDEERVSVQKEIEYLQSYIDLQRQRFADNVVIIAEMNEGNYQHQIQPMLLIPFVENAFKHGTGLLTSPEIQIHLRADNEKLYFVVRNKFQANLQEVRDKDSGIGLANVQRRLELLYPDRHVLSIGKQDDWFNVSLEITLK